MPDIKLVDMFPAWHSLTAKPTAVAWTLDADWDDQKFLEQLIELVEDELGTRFGRPPEEVTEFGAAILEDLVNSAPVIVVPRIEVQRSFLRFFVSVRLIEYCQTNGRISLAFDWLLLSISDERWAFVEAGKPLEVDYFPDRLRQFLMSTIPVICGTAPWVVLTFVRSLFYYSWKSGGLRELAHLVLEDAQTFVNLSIESADAELVTLGVEAASALVSWCLQGGRPGAPGVVRKMIELYDRPNVPDSAKKVIAITLATAIGNRSGHSSVEWARRALTQHGALLVQHEPVQMRIASCATPEEMAENYEDVLTAVERFTRDCDDHYSGDRVEIAFRRIQLFPVFVPFIVGLVRGGNCSKAVEATAAWFSVPSARRRRSPVLAIIAGVEEGVIYGVEGRSVTISHVSANTHRELVDAVNQAFDMSIVVLDDHSIPLRPKVGRRGERGRYADELADATAAYYEVDRAAETINETQGLALFQPHSFGAPLIPLVHSRVGITWPTVTSFEQPATDRPIRKALIWSYGTILGGLEARAVAAILEAAGLECLLLADKELSPDEFLDFYTDGSFDLIWVSAHGMFDPRVPQQAYFELSADKSKAMFLIELIKHSVPGPGRRLLFLNICLGASVAVIEAPPKLGLAAMLASAEQAVVSHFVEVPSFVAPLFGVGTAIPLGRGKGFLDAFSQALNIVRLERDAAFELVNQAAPQCAEFLNWLRNGTYGVDQGDIRTWGTAVFYE